MDVICGLLVLAMVDITSRSTHRGERTSVVWACHTALLGHLICHIGDGGWKVGGETCRESAVVDDRSRQPRVKKRKIHTVLVQYSAVREATVTTGRRMNSVVRGKSTSRDCGSSDSSKCGLTRGTQVLNVPHVFRITRSL